MWALPAQVRILPTTLLFIFSSFFFPFLFKSDQRHLGFIVLGFIVLG
jgi:hypothetical protein